MSKRHKERVSIFSIIRQRQIKTPEKYHTTLDRMAIIKKKKNLQRINAGEGVENREPL